MHNIEITIIYHNCSFGLANKAKWWEWSMWIRRVSWDSQSYKCERMDFQTLSVGILHSLKSLKQKCR
jgi:hypothetical protein